MRTKDFIATYVRALANSPRAIKIRFPDFDSSVRETIKRTRPYTLTSPQRIAALCDAIRYVEANEVPGAFVECGVYKGGSSMAAALCFNNPRDLYLFDTFEGMPAPGGFDFRASDSIQAEELLTAAPKSATIWCYSSVQEVASNMASTGYPAERIHLVKGPVEQTLPARAPDNIAILRLDTDWYESTKHELEHLYPRLSPGGVLIIDDYGYWAGARKAVDEYFGGSLFLSRIDSTGRIAIKPAPVSLR